MTNGGKKHGALSKARSLNKWWAPSSEGAADWREDVRRRLQRKIWALQRGPRPHCVLGITKYPSVNLFTAPLAPHCLSRPPVIHYSSCWIERWERRKLHPARVKRAALQKNLYLSKTLSFSGFKDFWWGYFFPQFYRCKKKKRKVDACLFVFADGLRFPAGEGTLWEHRAPPGQAGRRRKDRSQSDRPHQTRGSWW